MAGLLALPILKSSHPCDDSDVIENADSVHNRIGITVAGQLPFFTEFPFSSRLRRDTKTFVEKEQAADTIYLLHIEKSTHMLKHSSLAFLTFGMIILIAGNARSSKRLFANISTSQYSDSMAHPLHH